MVRRACEDDLGALVAMAREFYAQSGYGSLLTFSDSVVRSRAEYMLGAHDEGGILVNDDVTGAIWFEVYPSPVSDDLLASERILWVDKATRVRSPMTALALVRAYEREAKARGAKFTTLSRQMMNEQAAAFYTAMKYRPSDVLYAKEL